MAGKKKAAKKKAKKAAKKKTARKKAASRKGASRGKSKSAFSKSDLEHFREKLLERRRRILDNVTSMESEALKASDQDFSVDHMADHGSDNYEQDFTLSLVESERRELQDIDAALERIRNGTYGICEGTGEPIGRARLEAIPYARYSIEYQRRIEAGEVIEEEGEEE